MGDLVTPADAFAAVAAWSALAFADPDPALAGWVWHDVGETDAVAAPSAWPELVTGRRNSKQLSRLTVRTTVLIEQLETGPTSAQVLDATDRLVSRWLTSPPGLSLTDWSYQTVEIEVGGVPHTGLAFDVTIEHTATQC